MKKMQHFIQQWDELQAFLQTSVDELRERVETLVEAHREVDDTVNLERDIGWPSTYAGWDIGDMTWDGAHLRVDFVYHIPYDDWEENTTLWIDPDWWEISDEELLEDVLDRVKYSQQEQELNDIRLMKTLARTYGYELKK